MKEGITAFLARRALSVESGNLPKDTLVIARHCLLDWFTLVLASWHTPAVNQLKDFIAESGMPPGPATLLGSGVRTSAETATMLNGTAGHVLDFDDAHLKSRVHPSVPLWPAILAYGEQAGLAGERVLAAFVAGVEVQSRLAALMGESHYRLGWHNTATLGTFGATAAIGLLRGLNETELRHAFGIAATMAGGLQAVFGTTTKPLQAARAAANGLFAAGLAGTGFLSNPSILDENGGFPVLYAKDLFTDSPQQQANHWCIRDIVFKYHASCYGTQAPIGAALGLGQLRPQSVSVVNVYIEPQYMAVCNIQAPATEAEAKFSVRHTVALALAGKDTASSASFEPEIMTADTDLRAWFERIHVYPDSNLARANACVEIMFTSGERKVSIFDASSPAVDLSAQEKQLLNKSAVLLRELTIDQGNIETLQHKLLNIESCPDVSQWMKSYRSWLAEAHVVHGQ